MKKNSLAALLLSFILLVGALPTAAFAADGAYVLMNIPYAEFYRAELGENGAPDAVSAATPMKRSNGGLAKGSYTNLAKPAVSLDWKTVGFILPRAQQLPQAAVDVKTRCAALLRMLPPRAEHEFDQQARAHGQHEPQHGLRKGKMRAVLVEPRLKSAVMRRFG